MMLRRYMVLAAALLCAQAVSATTYVGHRNFTTASVDLSVTTDGMLGVLSAVNLTDFTVTITEGVLSITLTGPLSGNNSRLFVSGAGLSASASQLSFDYGASGDAGFVFVPPPCTFNLCNVQLRQPSYCIRCHDFFGNGAESAYLFSGFNQVRRSQGVELIAAATVPEPATWSLLILGFAMTGQRLRRAAIFA